MRERIQFVGVTLIALFAGILASPLLLILALVGVLVAGYWYLTGDMKITVKDRSEGK